MTEYKTLKDSGKREDMDTGSRRDTQDGKSRPDLMNPLVLRRLGMHFANGCEKYGEKNFELGQKTSRYRASLGRHLLDYDEGLKDEDHLSAIIWNAMCIVMNQEFVERGIYDPEIDDFTDYLNRTGFDDTVGQRARAHNDKLRRQEDMAQNERYEVESEDDSPVFQPEQKLLPECIPVPATTIELGDFRHIPGHLTMPIIDRESNPYTDIESTVKMIEDTFIQPIIQGYEEFMKKSMVEPGHTGYCMGDFDPIKCHDCFTLDDCVAMGDREREEKLEELIDVPELPVCFGKCGAEGDGSTCPDCNDKEECDTLVCSDDCDFRIECRDDFVRPDDDSTFLDDMMVEVKSYPPPTPLIQNEEPLVHDPDMHSCTNCTHKTIMWNEFPCRSCLRNDSMNSNSICPLNYWTEEEK